jgi:hypothetical protein
LETPSGRRLNPRGHQYLAQAAIGGMQIILRKRQEKALCDASSSGSSDAIVSSASVPVFSNRTLRTFASFARKPSSRAYTPRRRKLIGRP